LKTNTFFRRFSPQVLLILFFWISWSASGQQYWTAASAPKASPSQFEVWGSSYYQLSASGTQQGIPSYKSFSNQLVLPNEMGKEEVFQLREIPILSPALALQYPSLKTYEGTSIERPKVTVRVSSSRAGINAWIQGLEGPDLFIQPVKAQKGLHYSYRKTQYDQRTPFYCKTEALLTREKAKSNPSTAKNFSNTLRSFRIAIAATSGYVNHWGDENDENGTNQEDALAAVVSTINRISSVFEADLNVRLTLVSGIDLLYADANTDPFTGEYGDQLQTTLDTVLGDSEYDVGHLFDFGEPNGDAGCIACVCVSGSKGQGYSTHPFEDIYGGEYRNDYFDLDYAGHEIGHQFGAYHTFGFDAEGTGVNAEPGSGSTIMGYAGITGVDDVQLHGDPYFHYYSIESIRDYVATLSCGETQTQNAPLLVVSAGLDYVIPKGTAYELSASSNATSDDVTYSWEQLDSGQITASNFGPYNAAGAMARSLPPTSSPSRMIPKITRVLANKLTQENPKVNDPWETVPLIGRSMRWGVTARQPFEEGHNVSQDDMSITVVSTAGPFEVTSQNNDSVLWKGGAKERITWKVGGTDISPINAQEVELYLSTNGGLTFPILLADNVPNTGSYEVEVPNSIDADRARIKIKAKNNIFFAVNTVNFSVRSRDIVLQFDPYRVENCGQNSQRFSFAILSKEGVTASFSLQADELPNGVRASFSKSNYGANDTSGYITFSGLSALIPNDYQWSIRTQGSAVEEAFPVVLQQRSASFTALALNVPEDQSTAIDLRPLLEWQSNPNADLYRVQLANSESFSTVLLDSLVSTPYLRLTDLTPNTKYYWRVQQQNNCGKSAFTSPFVFETNSLSCLSLTSEELPQVLKDATNFTSGVTFVYIPVYYDLPIVDLDVLVNIEHTWLEDLSLYLLSPNNKEYLLSSGLGESEDDYTQTLFDQEAESDIFEGSAPFTGSFKPLQSIEELYGTSPKGLWKLKIEDQFVEDSGRVTEVQLNFCLAGEALPNSDADSFADVDDNCPEISNEDQLDTDENGIGDVCDVFSAQNITLSKKNTSCPDKNNGALEINAKADIAYRAEILGPANFKGNYVFSVLGKLVTDLAPGQYSICVTADQYPDFIYCFETEILAPAPLDVQAVFQPSLATVSLNLSGSDQYTVEVNNQEVELSGTQQIEIPLTQKQTRIKVTTSLDCQGSYESWFNLDQFARVVPNPVRDQATLILPEGQTPEVFLYGPSGDLLWQGESQRSDNQTLVLPMEQYAPGWYLVQLNYSSYSETLKLLKR